MMDRQRVWSTRLTGVSKRRVLHGVPEGNRSRLEDSKDDMKAVNNQQEPTLVDECCAKITNYNKLQECP